MTSAKVGGGGATPVGPCEALPERVRRPEPGETIEGHGGLLALAPLVAAGATACFTLSGGHVFPIYDAALRFGLPLYDVRHEQTAGFAAEGLAKLTRAPGLAVVTAGPGVTNVTSAVATARATGSPLVVLGGRAAAEGWGRGALQELDHVPILAPLALTAETARTTGEIPARSAAAWARAGRAHRGPTFLDLPLDVLYGSDRTTVPDARPAPTGPADPDQVLAAVRLLARAERPVVVAGGDVWWEGAWEALAAAVEALEIPTFTNGLGRGCLPAGHPLAFSRARSALRRADVVAVVGTPLDFRLGFGAFGGAAVIHVVDAPEALEARVASAAAPAGSIRQTLAAWAEWTGPRRDHRSWIAELRDLEDRRRTDEANLLDAASEPIHPARVYGALRRVLDPDAVVAGDGGDFVSWAGRLVDSARPGCWLDPGPFGCLGTGPGYAMAARIAHPDRQVVLLSGDGALGFAGMDLDSLVRHRLPVAIVVGNNGIWGLEKHPMRALYGYDVLAELTPETRYDRVCEALGGAGETVRRPGELEGALRRALEAGVPYLVNVLLDPEVAYPRSSSLA